MWRDGELGVGGSNTASSSARYLLVLEIRRRRRRLRRGLVDRRLQASLDRFVLAEGEGLGRAGRGRVGLRVAEVGVLDLVRLRVGHEDVGHRRSRGAGREGDGGNGKLLASPTAFLGFRSKPVFEKFKN